MPYNRFPADPLTPFADPYSYHALAVHGSKFPVNIELDYIRPGAQPPEQGGLGPPRCWPRCASLESGRRAR
ncbi:hypothetical protein ACU4GD_42145 [Cupriavidus basilensis]